MSPQETARAILALYDGKPERWTQGALARAVRSVSPTSERATCWCVIGAAMRVGCTDANLTDSRWHLAMARTTGQPTGRWISLWNDAPERTFVDVVEALERIAAEPEAAS